VAGKKSVENGGAVTAAAAVRQGAVDCVISQIIGARGRLEATDFGAPADQAGKAVFQPVLRITMAIPDGVGAEIRIRIAVVGAGLGHEIEQAGFELGEALESQRAIIGFIDLASVDHD